MLREWLRVFRAQTAPATLLLLEAVYSALYSAGGGRVFFWSGLELALFAVATHWFSFGHNSLMDTAHA